MEFKLILGPGAQFNSVVGLWEDGTEHDICLLSILINICVTLQETTETQFTVTGFDLRWPVEVYPELCILLEHIPEAIKAIECREPFEILFYEQGIQRLISFAPEHEKYVATCLDMMSKVSLPNATGEEIDRLVLRNMLAEIRDNLMTYLRDVYPPIGNHPELNHFFFG